MDPKHTPTEHDPFCECGYAKHDHFGGTGALAREDATVECRAFRPAKDGPPPRKLGETGHVLGENGKTDPDFAGTQGERGNRIHRRDQR